MSLPLHLIFSYIVSLLVALGLSEHEQHTQNSELEVSVIAPIIQQGAAASRFDVVVTTIC